ncbi:hypothetical protein ASF66_04340 [Pseudomonas sp. Leaf129]|uniref:DUF4214 domain-containing protein n=1 Tax=Pseudomonas sp. Leaf129 TaxID=1736268 RepID=UPI000702B5C1|nr:DUF4214 domain-containing protein [Pseudomonas sp. Leaf129]KQQ63581.1 hypothetical protein ASF66_04340 [Pseudomonas sp. Leaf129]
MQYDQPYSASELKGSLANNPTLLSSTTAAAISTLLALDTAETVSVASWDGVAAPVSPEGTTPQLVTAEIAGAAGDTVVLEIPAELSSAQAFVFESEANLAATFNTQAAPAAFAASAVAEDAAVTAVTDSNPDLIVTSGNGDDTLIFKGDQNVYVDGRDGNDVIVTAAGNDTIYGGAGNNVILSGAGNDEIFLAGTADVVDAGDGYDIVHLQGSRSGYEFTDGNNFNVNLTGTQVASISNAEFLSFDNNESVVLVDTEVEASALRLFQGVLGRDADVSGAQAWAGQAEQGVSITDIAQQFLDSGEYKATSNEDFVNSLYENLLSRTTADEDGVQNWLNVLSAGGSRLDVISGIATSQEAITLDQSNAQFVDGLYDSVLGRDVEEGGLNNWVSALVNGASRAEVAQDILNSGEALSKANSDFIDSLYSNSLGREADAAGKANWVEYIAQGHSLADVAVGIVGSEEAATTIDNVIVIHGQV